MLAGEEKSVCRPALKRFSHKERYTRRGSQKYNKDPVRTRDSCLWYSL